MSLRRLSIALLSVALIASLAAGLVSHKVSAAGSAIVSVEMSPAKAAPGQDVTLRFYVTPAGAKVNSVSVNATLTNLSFVSYTGSGSSFNGAAQLAGTPSATNFTAIGAFQSFGGTANKALIVSVTARAATSGGVGTVGLSAAEAYDTSESPMLTTAQSGNIIITGSPVSGGGSTGTTENIAIMPSDQAGPNVSGVEVSEADLLAAQNKSETDVAFYETVLKQGSNYAPMGTAMVIGIILLGTSVVWLIGRLKRSHELNRHIMTGASYTTVGGTAAQPIISNKAKKASKPSGPIIINPQ